MANENNKNIFFFIIGILLVVSVFVIIKIVNENRNLKQINEQNKKAMEEFKEEVIDNQISYFKFIEVQTDLIDSLAKMIKTKDDQVLYYTKTTIQLQKLISQGFGSIKDTVFLKDECIGLEMNFGDTTDLYDYDLYVRVDKKPYHRLSYNIKPITDVYSFISVDDNGLWKTNIIFPERYNNFLSIKNIETKVDEKLFKDYQNNLFQNVFSFMVSAGLDIKDQVYFRMGGGIKYESYLLEYQKGINNNFHYINLGKFFTLF